MMDKPAYRVEACASRGRYCVATRKIAKGEVALRAEVLAIALNDDLLRRGTRCAVCAAPDPDAACGACGGALCTACAGAEHGCALVADARAAPGAETRHARLLCAARVADGGRDAQRSLSLIHI